MPVLTRLDPVLKEKKNAIKNITGPTDKIRLQIVDQLKAPNLNRSMISS